MAATGVAEGADVGGTEVGACKTVLLGLVDGGFWAACSEAGRFW